ncbi:MAG: T9SS type A sorting domain-containing protein [Bacteroidetes bacterium]|nr:T9SS type A sorting domain-containing protein [Bacteroidota bacterium]MBU1718488.1 T9SS type A sorting domain-containing protein [Bacteroidota bacterium]
MWYISNYDFTYTGEYTGIETLLWKFGNDAIPQTSTEMNPKNISLGIEGEKEISLLVDRNGCSTELTRKINFSGTECGKDKVRVCHNGKSICISRNALPAHLAHGDCLGYCSEDKSYLSASSGDFSPETIEIIFDTDRDKIIINSSIPLANTTCSIFDCAGRLLYFKEIGNLAEGISYLSTIYLPRGIYLLRIASDEAINSSRIIKF